MRFSALSIAVVALIATSVTAFEPVPNYTLDLDKPPEERWVGAVEMVVKNHGWDNSMGGILDMYYPIFDIVPYFLLERVAKHLKDRFPESHGEATGIYNAIKKLGYGHKYNETFFYVMPFFYEVAHIGLDVKDKKAFARACTGILSLPKDKSLPMIHGRNLDEKPHQSRNMTLNITVIKGGEYVYSIFDYTWVTTGCYTASRVGGVTLEENWRDHHPRGLVPLLEKILDNSTIPVALMFRRVQEQKMDFDAAVKYLTTIDLAAPAYVIMSGSQRRGAILTLYYNKSNNVKEFLNDTSSVTFKVQTNYDRWLPDPPSDPRRTVAQNALSAVGRARSGTELGVWMALSTYPVHNPGTMFSALMMYDRVPEGYIRRAMLPDPSDPFQ